MFQRVLIANRGEIAVRVVRACKEMGILTVVAHSDADRESLGVLLADDSVCIGPAASDKSYLNIANVVSAAQVTGCDAIHPGYGFLAENAYLAEVCDEVGITFIGPSAAAIEEFSDKVKARNRMAALGLPVIPGTNETLLSADDALAAARAIGFPVMVKATAGGGGRGMRVARDAGELTQSFPIAQIEAQAHFGSGELYLERLLVRGRHIEVQIAADKHGNVVHLGDRECSLQRRHQKLVEESPPPGFGSRGRSRMLALATDAISATDYTNIGTLEFLVDQAGDFYFLEMNSRLQVEHPVTELVTGVDLVKLQIALAAGDPLPFRQEDIHHRGHALECRITAEDATRDFAPASGRIQMAHFPGGPWTRVDTHVYSGYVTPPYYDSLLAKLIVWGSDRAEAVARMKRAVEETHLEGVRTNLPFLARLLSDERFQAGEVDIEFVDRHLMELAQEPVAQGIGRA